MSAPYAISEDEYAEIEEAIAASPKGRAFLRLRDSRARAVSDTQLREFALGLQNQVRGLFEADNMASDAQVQVLRRELQAMSSCIHQTRQQIVELQPAESGDSRIVAATNELDAIVSACERATSEILNAAERISEIAHEKASADDPAALGVEIDRYVTEILTACSFQDITGQRTTKVVNTLRYIEMRIDSMIQIWGAEGDLVRVAPEIADQRADSHLLNGPALEGGVSQADIDAFFDDGETLVNPADSEIVVEAAPKLPAPPKKSKPPRIAKPERANVVPLTREVPPPSAIASQADIDALFA